MLEINAAGWMTLALAVGWLVVLEGLLSADNALVLAVMVRHLPKDQQKCALRYGMVGAFTFRAIAVVFASLLLRFWQLKVFGGLYLVVIAVRHFLHPDDDRDANKPRMGRGFWGTVIGVELADVAFSIDSILAAVATAEGLPKSLVQPHVATLPLIGPITVKMIVIWVGGILGIIAMRLVAGVFLKLLDRFRGLTAGAYLLVGWIGLKLIGSGLATWRQSLPTDMPEWLFWAGMGLIVVGSLLYKPGGRGVSKEEREALVEALGDGDETNRV